MKRKFKSILAGVLCFACLPVMPLYTSAKVSNVQEYDELQEMAPDRYVDPIYYHHICSFDSDLFSYKNSGHYTNNDPAKSVYYLNGTLTTDVTNANTVVTGIFYLDDETEPSYYTVNSIVHGRENGSPASWSSMVDAKDIEPYLNGQTLEVGDLLYISQNMLILDLSPGGILTFQNDSDEEDIEVVYFGNGVDILGEDFRKVMYYELYTPPHVYYENIVSDGGIEHHHYNKSCYDLGNLNNDDNIDLLDVITLNKNLMTGYSIGYYAKGCADVDNNGVVDAVDSLNILKYVVGLIDSFDELQ